MIQVAPMSQRLAETMHFRRRKRRVLLVEDDEVYARIAMVMLEKIGCEATAVFRGHEGISICRTQEFDLALIDLILPDASGLDIATTLQLSHPEMGLAIYSGSVVESSFVCDALNQGFTILGKPLRPQNVLSLLTRPSVIAA